MAPTTALIGGTGLTQWPAAKVLDSKPVESPFGAPSAQPALLEISGRECVFLPRHGHPHALPPHKINYRANIDVLRSMGVKQIIAINAVGGIAPDCATGTLVIPDQIIDYTWGREHTFFDGESAALEHVDFSYPYSERVRQALIAAADDTAVDVVKSGVYGATQGPRLETASEVKRLSQDGCTIVGMTGMPEAALAREAGIEYGSLCVVVNPAAGLSNVEITMEDIHQVLETGMRSVRELLTKFLQTQ